MQMKFFPVLMFICFQYLSSADFAMREELSLKIAILSEKFAPDLSWYGNVSKDKYIFCYQA